MRQMLAIRLAAEIGKSLGHAHRGAIRSDDGRYIVRFGNEGYGQDDNVRQYVAKLERRLVKRDWYVTLGVDPTSYTWVLVTLAGEAELDQEFDDVWSAWAKNRGLPFHHCFQYGLAEAAIAEVRLVIRRGRPAIERIRQTDVKDPMGRHLLSRGSETVTLLVGGAGYKASVVQVNDATGSAYEFVVLGEDIGTPSGLCEPSEEKAFFRAGSILPCAYADDCDAVTGHRVMKLMTLKS